MSDGVHAAFWLLGFIIGMLTIAVPVTVLVAVAWSIWTGPAARTAMRLRAWRMIRHLRRGS